MKYLIGLTLLLLLTGCNCSAKKEKRYMKAIEFCGKQGGVPMVNDYGRMTDCKFTTKTSNTKTLNTKDLSM